MRDWVFVVLEAKHIQYYQGLVHFHYLPVAPYSWFLTMFDLWGLWLQHRNQNLRRPCVLIPWQSNENWLGEQILAIMNHVKNSATRRNFSLWVRFWMTKLCFKANFLLEFGFVRPLYEMEISPPHMLDTRVSFPLVMKTLWHFHLIAMRSIYYLRFKNKFTLAPAELLPSWPGLV